MCIHECTFNHKCLELMADSLPCPLAVCVGSLEPELTIYMNVCAQCQDEVQEVHKSMTGGLAKLNASSCNICRDARLCGPGATAAIQEFLEVTLHLDPEQCLFLSMLCESATYICPSEHCTPGATFSTAVPIHVEQHTMHTWYTQCMAANVDSMPAYPFKPL